MKITTRAISVLVFLSLAFSFFAIGQQAAPTQGGDFAAYSNDQIFEQMSGAKRSVLEIKFGKKHNAAIDKILSSWMAQPSFEGNMGISPNPNITLNPPVNNRLADATAQDTQSETSIVLVDANTGVVAFNDSGSFLGGAQKFTGWARSTDGGANFTDLGALPTNANGDAGDPALARSSSTGTIILSTLTFNDNVLNIFRSTDAGATWLAPVDGTGGTTTGSHDKEWVAADNFAGSGQGNFYMFWRDFGTGGGMSFTRSTNDGVSWSTRQVLAAASGQGAFVAVAPDHSVNVFWLSGTNLVRRKSTDLGVTFGAQSTVQTLVTGGVNGDLGLNGGFRTNAFPHAVISPVTGFQYIVFNDVGVAGGDKADCYIKFSTDGGATWSAKTRVNDDATTTDQWQPTLAITPDGTHLVVTWYDRRLDGNNIDRFGIMAAIDGGTGAPLFGGSFRISTASFPVVIGQDPVINTVYMGDYDFAAAVNTAFWVIWGDNRDPLLTHLHQPDVRSATFAPEDPGAILNGTITLTNDGCGGGNGVIDPNEVVTIDVAVTNTGLQPTVNLVGTLQATGGVTLPSGPQNYGVIPIGGTVTRSFTFTATGTCGGTLTTTVSLQDGATSFPDVTKVWTLGTNSTLTFTNSTTINVVDNAAANPYPSNITVSGVTTYDRITVSLGGLTHTFPDDVDIILVGPGGQKAYVISDVGGSGDVVAVPITLDDNAAAQMADGGPYAAGTYKPSNVDTTTDAFPAPAPAGPYDTTFAAFAGLGAAANGTWSLYVRDDAGQDTGTIAGWSLNFISFNCCSGSSNNPPTAVDDNATVNENTSNNTIDVLANDSDPDADTLTVTGVSDPPNGTAAVGGGGTNVTYTPDPSFVGSDSFTYDISDGNGGTDTATVFVTVNAVNNPPTAVDDNATVLENSSGNTVDVLANDSDPDADTLTVTGVSDPPNGTAAVGGGGTNVTYTPDPSFVGSDSFTYDISDGNGGTDTATVFVTVNAVNTPPNAVDDNASVNENSSNNAIDVLANDSDPDANPLTVTGVSDPPNGTAAVGGGGTNVTYTPDPSFVGSDSFTYDISDGQGGTDTATVFVTVNAVNNPPTAVDDSTTVNRDTTNNVVDVLANDTDPDADTLTVTAVSDPPNGTATIGGGGTNVLYTPDPGFSGSDSFTYDISDGNGGTDTATVNVTVVGCLLQDDFEDGVVDTSLWTVLKPNFIENTGDFVGTPAPKQAQVIATGFAGCGAGCSVDTTMSATPVHNGKAWVLGWYIDKKNTVELIMRETKWILKQRSGGHVAAKMKFAQTHVDGQVYAVHLAFDGTNFVLTVDGVDIITMPKGAATNPTGTFGYKVKRTTARYSNICVN